MKKLFFGMLAIVAMIATSCQQEVDLGVGSVGETATVSINVGTPTRAYSDGTTATVLQYAVYQGEAAETMNYLSELTGVTTLENRGATVPLQLVTGNTYTVVFWASAPTSPYTFNPAQRTVTANYSDVLCNNENLDAFYKTHTFTVQGAQTETIELRRPFAQLNIGTDDYEAAGKAGYTPTQSTVTVANIANTLNLWDGTVSGDVQVTFDWANINKAEAFPVDDTKYDYLAMNYLLVGADSKTIEVEFACTDGATVKTRTVGSVPVQRNHRTNLYGSILTSDVAINVIIKPEYEEPAHEAALQTAATVGGEITLTEDVALEGVLNVQRPLTINLNGHTINGTFTKGGDGANAMIKNNATLTIVGGTIKNTTENGDAAIYNTGNLVLDGVKIEGAPIGTTGYPEYAVYSVGGTVVVEEGTEIVTDRGVIRLENGADVTINGGSFVVNNNTTATLTSHVIYAKGSASKLTINGGDFAQNIDNGGGTSVICPAGATINIYGGNFYHVPVADFQSKIFQNYMGYGAPVDVYGGTYNDDSVTKSGNLAAGYKAVEKDGVYYVIANDTELVSSTAQFSDALSAGKNVHLASDVNIAKIDLTSVSNDVVIDGNGNSITTASSYGVEVTAGKNITLKNAEVVITVNGDYINYAAGFKISNGDYTGKTIKLENCVIRMANTDWAYAVTMPASVKNLNLVIDNCVLEGALALQCWGDNNTITITDSKLICNYTTSALYTSYCVALQGDGTYNAENNELAISNCEFSYSGVDNFNSEILSVYAHEYTNTNTITVSDCTYVGVTAY